MIIAAIDPGPEKSGVILWNPEATLKLKFNAEVLNIELYKMLHGSNANFPFDMLAIENIRGYGIPAGNDTFDTCIWIGRFDHRKTAMLIGRKDIKKNLCGNTTTNDKYVRQALIDRYGEVGTKKAPGPLFGVAGHMWSALAVAVTAQDILSGKYRI